MIKFYKSNRYLQKNKFIAGYSTHIFIFFVLHSEWNLEHTVVIKRNDYLNYVYFKRLN